MLLKSKTSNYWAINGGNVFISFSAVAHYRSRHNGFVLAATTIFSSFFSPNTVALCCFTSAIYWLVAFIGRQCMLDPPFYKGSVAPCPDYISVENHITHTVVWWSQASSPPPVSHCFSCEYLLLRTQLICPPRFRCCSVSGMLIWS